MSAKKLIILSLVLGLGILPSFAKIEGGVSKDLFYDTDKTIMSETPLNKNIKTGKYWDKNLLYFNKYSPLFMLSNKELYDLMPKENVSIVQRITTPSIYNISLKASSIKKVSFNPPKVAKQTPVVTENKNANLNLVYELAKNPQTEPEKKIDAAILLKNSKKPSNYVLALDLLEDVTQQEPYNAYAFYLKGEIYYQKKDSQNAMKNYVEALKINPASKQCCLGIAKILEPTNKMLAQKYYDKAAIAE